MTITNGYIRITRSAGGFDAGRPRRGQALTSGFIPANVSENTRRHGTAGEQTVATAGAYCVLVEPTLAPDISDRDTIEVFDSRRVSLGSYPVQAARLLDFVDVIQITL